jgi:glucans biosynthesis protein
VFQGASYFRALSKGQAYGLSARGLSIGTGQTSPEEFPDFRAFWIEKPASRDAIIIHALMDSPSAAGAFTFTVHPGAPTVIEVEAAIYPRHDVANIGIAPLTSMYFYSVGDGTASARDYRPAVHDSDGLLIANGRSERLWRPLRNPPSLRASSFADAHPKGFGLMQRQRDFEQYQDLEARYHRRPSAWVEPHGDWGEGSVELFELPTDSEYHDNIVTQWKPAQPLRAGERYRFAYRLSWPDGGSDANAGAIVNWTRSGPAGLPSVSGDTERFVIDYHLTGKLEDTSLPEAIVSASAGTVSGVAVQHNAMTGGLRVSFLFDPGPNLVADLRVSLPLPGNAAEVWLYQWTSRRQPGGAL